ncbi:hypothetical protein EMIHUDRAFT_42817, partial [Emiliania huxleyi CCMP1516]|uniref:Uncharacterized protein n=2 Tax=Emiliania huxleyi TaxID=2903 RepID=A0A0D3KAD9_EMIH1
SLDVGGNSLTEEAALSIVRIERQRSKLTSLGLAGCSVGPTGAAEIAEDADGVNRVLTDLNLGNNEIRDEGAAAIAEALRGNRVLTDLNLGNNEIRDEGAAAIAEALRVNGVLTKLYLAFNSIGDDGAEALASALRVNGVLKNINLLRNDITVEGAALLLKLFRKRRHMESLCGVTPGQTEANFANMRLGDADAVLIGADLEFNGVLKNLELQDNSIGKDGAAALASALRVNGVLKDLKLWNNNLGGEG